MAVAFLLFVLPSATAVFGQVQVWPFSNYPMYAQLPDNLTGKFFYGITHVYDSGERRNLKSLFDLFPLARSHLTEALTRIVDAGRVEPVLQYYLSRAGAGVRCVQMEKIFFQADERVNKDSAKIEIVSKACHDPR